MNEKKLVIIVNEDETIIVNEDETKEVKVYQAKEQYKKMKKRIMELYEVCSFFEYNEKNIVVLIAKKASKLSERCIWYENEYINGYYDAHGKLCICHEFGLDIYAPDVVTRFGFTDEVGRYHSFGMSCRLQHLHYYPNRHLQQTQALSHYLHYPEKNKNAICRHNIDGTIQFVTDGYAVVARAEARTIPI